MNYIIVSIGCISGLAIALISLYENEILLIEQKKLLSTVAVIIIAEVIIDTVSFAIDGKISRNIEIYKLLKIVEFSISPLIPVIIAKIITRRSFWKKIQPLFNVLIISNIVLQVTTFFIPLMFYIDENAVYHRTVFSYVYFMVLIISVVALFLASLNTFIQSTEKMSWTLIGASILIGIGVTTREIIEQCNSDWLSISFCYFIFILYFNNSYLRIDSVSSLLNRAAFDHKSANINFSTVVFIIDANNFKSINDTYGHQCGDWAISKIAEAILNAFGKIGFCYRIGGDEFGVILKPNMLEKLSYQAPNHDTYEMIKSLEKRLDEEMLKISRENPILKDGLSSGFGIYTSPRRNYDGDDYKTFKEVLEIADKRMYQKKNLKKGARV